MYFVLGEFCGLSLYLLIGGGDGDFPLEYFDDVRGGEGVNNRCLEIRTGETSFPFDGEIELRLLLGLESTGEYFRILGGVGGDGALIVFLAGERSRCDFFTTGDGDLFK